jgi:hypothetical protein
MSTGTGLDNAVFSMKYTKTTATTRTANPKTLMSRHRKRTMYAASRYPMAWYVAKRRKLRCGLHWLDIIRARVDGDIQFNRSGVIGDPPTDGGWRMFRIIRPTKSCL